LRFPGGASPSQFDDSQTRNKSPEWFFPSHARVGTLGRMKRVARSHRAPDRVRATTASFRAPASDFSPSLSLCRFRIERTKRCVLRVRVLVSILVSCTRVVDPDPFISFHFISFRPRSSPPGTLAPAFVRAHPREHVILGTRSPMSGVVGCGTDANARGSIGLGETLTDGWMDGSRSGRRPRLFRSGDATTAGSRPW
jgi:hypothetical protein